MDLTPSVRRKTGTVTYAKRNRTPASSTPSSPAVADRSFPVKITSTSSTSSDDEAGPSNSQLRHKDARGGSPSSQTIRAKDLSPKDRNALPPTSNDSVSPLARSGSTKGGARSSGKTLSAATPTGSTSASRAALTSKSASAATPGLFPKPGSSSADLSSTKSLPQRPARATSPTASRSQRLPLKRSASTSPRKLASSVSPSKRLARSRTPSRPAQDLASLFDAIEPTLPQPRNPFARSESQPIVRLHRDDADVSPDAEPVFAPSPLASPTLPALEFDRADDQLERNGSVSPSKRPRMADRMGVRAARPTRSKADEIAEALTNSRRGSLRRIETAPSAPSEAGHPPALLSDAAQRLREEGSRSARRSEAGSTLVDDASQVDTQSQDGARSASGARRLAGIKQASSGNAKRTYGLQRSFLADQTEDNLLNEAAVTSNSNTESRNIEDEIEAELKGKAPSNGHGTASSKASGSSLATPNGAADPAHAAPRESYAELLKKWGEGADDIEWDESQDPTLNLKSITSLRSQGELRRFNDDLEYLFSGLDASQSISIRRSSAVELINLLCGKPDLGSLAERDASDVDEDPNDDVEDPLAMAQSADFLRKLKASDSIVRLYDLFQGAEAGEGVDDVLDAAMAIYTAKLLRSASTAEPLIRERRSQLYFVLRNLLTRSDRTPCQDRKDGFALLRLHELKQLKIASKSDRKTLTELRDIARVSKLFVADSKSWTVRNLVLAACCSLISLPRRLLTEVAIGELLVDAHSAEDGSGTSLFSTVLSIVTSEGIKARQRLSDFAKGLELISSSAVEVIPDLETVDVCIRFLDKGMDALYLELDQAVLESSEILDALQQLASFAIHAAPFGASQATGDPEHRRELGTDRRALQVLHGLFKSLLDLSQVDANWSESLASSQPVQQAIMRAFSLSFLSALQIRSRAELSNGPSLGKSPRKQSKHAAADAVGEAGKVDVALFDDVVHLSLALLTNLLIKQLDKARDALHSVRLDPTCWRRRACTTECVCDTGLPALQLLARIFIDTRMAAASHDDSNAAYLSNSIATAIAQFAVGSAARLEICRAALDAELPASDSSVNKEDGFQTLLDAVEEFAVVHEAALHAEKAQIAEADSGATLDAEVKVENGDDVGSMEENAVDTPADSSNLVAAEAGQLIKDLAVSLRNMA
ncbi:hypothetical protein PHSY_005814 [Pseudozyma hubeiensis SY62]|uniref:Wings apart-like protein C-terminal domain-containing protein n=1 Tax=Pseudozyma hubeiensis (strain SY62) TaxID=1305764 RepID=R9PJD1_PSEHS|nr:hypothetical protein PHSY_005814 [Pseudozyma hubeiensis SY62]GAC98225.1 hypothetical protein PHSY_005814 [Pseudozyma hubeiensis SY62]